MRMTSTKHSYTVSCPTAFRNAILALAARRRVNAADVARSAMLLVSAHLIETCEDPGEPPAEDRETVVLKSGRARGRLWRRKPRLQVRLPSGLTPVFIRKALALALALDEGATTLSLASSQDRARQAAQERVRRERASAALNAVDQMKAMREEMERLRAVVSVLSFDPLPSGLRSASDALHVLGFPPGSRPGARDIRARFRMLATVHHPDGSFGNHERMSQLNAAMDMLRRS